MRERLTRCPLCKSGLFLNLLEVKDHAVSKENFLLCQCSKCDLIFTNPRPKEIDIEKYYDFESYISHQDKSNNFTNIIYKWVRKITLKKKISWLNKNTQIRGKLLDYGCGTGYFLKTAENDGWNVTGIEPNEKAMNIAQNFGLTVFNKIDDLEQVKKYDAITLFHVLEHIHSLRKTSKKILEKLKTNGILYIAVPNYDSYDSKYYKTNWAPLDVPRHLYHFTQKSMQRFAQEMKLEIIEQKPLIFDSFYVSILSENYINKNKSGINTFLKSLSIGWKSNRWAKKNNKNYSSILYILKKK